MLEFLGNLLLKGIKRFLEVLSTLKFFEIQDLPETHILRNPVKDFKNFSSKLLYGHFFLSINKISQREIT